MMVIIVSGLLVLIVIGYIATPFAAKNPRVQLSLSAEQRRNFETAIELEIQAIRKQEEATLPQAEE